MIGKQLKALMVERNLTASQICERAGIGAGCFSNWLHNRNRPSMLMIKKLADALGVPFEYFKSVPEREHIRPLVLTPIEAAKAIGSNAMSVRQRMIKNAYNPTIGTVINNTGNRYDYEIYPGRLASFLCISVDEMYDRINNYGQNGGGDVELEGSDG